MSTGISLWPPQRLSPRGAALIVVLSCLAAYANSFAGQFVFDDVHEIERNPSLRSLLPPWDAMFIGHKMPARPLPYLTFAINFWVSGKNPASYHAVNLLIHILASLALFDLVRSTLTSPRLRDRFAQRSVPIALVIAAVWACHPLQTQAVTYVYQRIESMAGMFALVSLACFARAAFSGWKPAWLAGCLAAAVGGMASKDHKPAIGRFQRTRSRPQRGLRTGPRSHRRPIWSWHCGTRAIRRPPQPWQRSRWATCAACWGRTTTSRCL